MEEEIGEVPFKELATNTGVLGDIGKKYVQEGIKGHLCGSTLCFPQLELIPSGEVIEFNTYEEYRAYIEENNLKEGDYKDCSTGMYFHIKYKTSFKPDRCL